MLTQKRLAGMEDRWWHWRIETRKSSEELRQGTFQKNRDKGKFLLIWKYFILLCPHFSNILSLSQCNGQVSLCWWLSRELIFVGTEESIIQVVAELLDDNFQDANDPCIIPKIFDALRPYCAFAKVKASGWDIGVSLEQSLSTTVVDRKDAWF